MPEDPPFRPGIIYGHQELNSKGLRAAPIVLLAPPTDDNLYSHVIHRSPGQSMYERVDKPRGRRRSTHRDIGWPAAGIYDGSSKVPEDLLSLTLADFLTVAANNPQGDGFRFILVTRLHHIHGPYDEVCRAEEAAYTEEVRERADRERTSATLTRLAANGIRIDPFKRQFDARQLEAIADLVDSFDKPAR